ncbi:MAG: glycogen(starch) synthase [Planctomycetota bacterium]|jgi:glycogen(starch) synthase
MKVLMLGWEFPPHISGGLGTACLGISEGLIQNGVKVAFVVPHLHGDEPQNGVDLVSASDVVITAPTTPSPALATPIAQIVAALSGSDQFDFELHAVDSPLRPYMTELEYANNLALPQSKHQKAQASKLSAPTAVLEQPSTGVEVQLQIGGGYGPDLFDEVNRYARVVQDLSDREDFDVVHAHDWMTFPAGIAAADQSGKPLILHVHACEYDRCGDRVDLNICAVEQAGFDRADRIICVSEYNKSLLCKNYDIDSAKIDVVHNAVTQREQRVKLKVEKTIEGPIVLFLGRITYQKGPDYFLEAAARVLKVMPDVQFVLSGTGDMWPKMVERAAQLGISEHTHFTGFLEGDQVERMFALADLYVMPSVSEPFGISTLEAMASDVPTIISRQSGAAEVLQSALKVDFWDVEDLASKILATLLYPALTDELSETGRVEVERMNWEERGSHFLRIYEDITQ